jgi:amino acid transporter
MALNHHLPKFFLKVNRHKVPYITLYANFFVGMLSFLPFPGWQKLVAFLSSASILSYSIGPICLLAMRKLQPDTPRPFKLSASFFCAHLSFYLCNLMLYWCGFTIIWKLNIALFLGLLLYSIYHRQRTRNIQLIWFLVYMTGLLIISYCGSFGGLGLLQFPLDMLVILPFSLLILSLSQILLNKDSHQIVTSDMEELFI